MPSLMAASRAPNRRCTLSPRSTRAERNASVAPIVDAHDTSTVPAITPKSAPPASVSTAAPGSDAAATST